MPETLTLYDLLPTEIHYFNSSLNTDDLESLRKMIFQRSKTHYVHVSANEYEIILKCYSR